MACTFTSAPGLEACWNCNVLSLIERIPLQLLFVFGKPRRCVARMLNGVPILIAGAVLWAHAPRLQPARKAHRQRTAYALRQHFSYFCLINKCSILSCSLIQSRAALYLF